MHTFLFGVHKLTTSAYSPIGNGGVERVYHTVAKILVIGLQRTPNDWDAHIFHVEYAYYNTASAATGLASNAIHIGRLPRSSLAVFDRSYGGAHQSFECDHLAYCDLARERQQRAYELVHEQHALTVACVNGRDSTPLEALFRDILILGNWTNPPSALHPTVSTAACQRSHARDHPHQW